MKKAARNRTIKLIVSLFFTICICYSFDEAHAEELQQGLHTTTVMVYMCGSDLESRFGQGTADLTEMMTSGLDERFTNLLVMAGGSKSWKTGFDAEKTTILQLGRSGMRVLWKSDQPLNMAEPSTLTTFLDYSVQHYPAERYALIIWDHGQGPNEGMCYDELFRGTVLSVEDLSNAVLDSAFYSVTGSSRLNWIGFDACLMASLETGILVSNVADYMIASQEQEPSSGWNYSFLKGLENDVDTPETARRIIDQYYEENTSAPFDVTLSCINLRALSSVQNAMNHFYGDLYAAIDSETFSELSKKRRRSPDYGRSGLVEYDDATPFSADEEGSFGGMAEYDLVDLTALTESYSQGLNTETSRYFLEAIREAVVYSRSSREGSYGLSVYHPCYNRTDYSAKWGEAYRNLFLDDLPNYVLFIRKYGQILCGQALGNWQGLETERSMDFNGDVRFSVTLTEDQAAHFESASLNVFRNFYDDSNGVCPDVMPIWSESNLELDENRTLTAVFRPKAIYAVDDESGEKLSLPLCYQTNADGKLSFKIVYWDDSTIFDEDLLITRYFCDYDRETGQIRVDYIAAYDELTRECSSRTLITEEFLKNGAYTEIAFFFPHIVPTWKGEDLVDCREWPESGNMHGFTLPIERKWHFEVCDCDVGNSLLSATILIQDTQNIGHSSPLCRVFPDLTWEVQPTQMVVEQTGELVLPEDTAAQWNSEAECFNLRLTPPDLPPQLFYFGAENIVLNETLSLPQLSFRAYRVDEDLQIGITDQMTYGLQSIQIIEFDLEAMLDYRNTYGKAHVRYALTDPLQIDDAERNVLAETKTASGLLWKLWSLEENARSYVITVQNCSNSMMEIKLDASVIDGFSDSLFETDTILPGRVSLYSLNGKSSPLYLYGITELREIEFRYSVQAEGKERKNEIAVFSLPEPIPCKSVLTQNTHIGAIPQAESETIGIGPARSTTYWNEELNCNILDLDLWFVNNDGMEHAVSFADLSVNGKATKQYRGPLETDHYYIIADSINFATLKMVLPENISSLETVGFTLLIDDTDQQDYLLDLKDFSFGND